ncbi:FAD/NAD(P)-binding protein [Streptomyces sp. NPDC020747]|uniref:FAD/NAD(P)-binding protein n=1 Tax=Streptomyces sp. NPDC020747 TaxID=3365086 RepID=UPI00378BC148
MTATAHEISVIGAGPRGLAVLERLCANERVRPSHSRVLVHVVDSTPVGAGAVWRTDQSRHLLANTVASQITVYSDAASRIDGPIEPGPSLYEWAVSLAAPRPDGDGADRAYDAGTLTEARRLEPNSYPTRALCGRYFADCFRRVRDGAPAHVEIRVHHSRAVAMADTHGYPGGPQGVRLANGTRLNQLDAVVLAQGHLPTRPTPQEERIASLSRINHLTYLPPANPADADLDGVPAGEPVLLRGLGLCFFDYLALFTLGRGGRFERVGDELVYRPSGREPVLYASSRRAVPYHSRGENEKGAHGRYLPRLLTADRVAGLRSRAEDGGAALSFKKDLWPLIAREVETVYYETLLASTRRTDEREAFAARYLASADRAECDGVLDAYGIPVAHRWNWNALTASARERDFTDRDDFRGWLLDRLHEDVRQAREGNVSGPLKAALDVLRDLRNEVRLAVDHGGLDGVSHRDELERWYTPLNAFLSIGPPPRRVEETIALIRSGVLELTGPDTRIRIDTRDGSFVADSGTVPGPTVRTRVLIEARLPEPDLRRTDDPLLRHLLNTEACAPYRIGTADGGVYETGGLAVTERPYHLVDAQGRAHPRRFAYGVPTESVHWVTAAGIRPGVDSVTIADADAIARAVLALDRSAAGTGPLAESGPIEVLV